MAGSSDYMRNYRTPQSNKRGKRKRKGSNSMSGISSSAVDALLGAAASSSGYGSAYQAGKLGISMAKKLFAKNNKTNESNTKVSYVKKGGMSGRLAGKLRKKGKKVNRKYNSMQQKGILYREEFRFQDDIGTANESRLVGHTSIPIRATYYNVFRALIKCLMAKAI